MNRKLEILKEKINKYYHSHGQHLIIDTWEVMQGDDNDCSFDIHLADSDIYLFEVLNYKGYEDLEGVNKSYFKKDRYTFFKTLDIVTVANSPLYMDRVFNLKTFKSITKEDIINCTEYFIHEVLHMWSIFNIKFAEDKDEKEDVPYKNLLIKGLNEL